MAEYIPNTQVRICKDVPLDSTYSDTIKFASAGAQSAYFAGKAKFTFTDFTYQRVNSSVASPRGPYSIRVPKVADQLYDCNYLCFQNTNYGSKWFYCFIKQVNYINPENTEIIYELDHYQTWAFDFEVLPSLVLREHSETDNFFENFEPEPVTLNGYKIQPADKRVLPNIRIMVAVSTDPTGKIVQGQMVNKIYSALEIHEFSDAGSANSFITEYAEEGHLENVVSVFMSPFTLAEASTNAPLAWNVNLTAPSLDLYTPRNKKLYNYPYTALIVSDFNNHNMELKYENFVGAGANGLSNGLQFNIYRTLSGNPTITLVPQYDGNSDNQYYALQSQTMPQCPWSGNVYANWLASQGTGAAIRNGLAMAMQMMNGNVLGAMSNVVNSYAIGTEVDHMTVPISMPLDSQYNFQRGQVGFQLFYKYIYQEDAKVIDDYFDMFGYATNQLKVPNMDSRENWNFVQTKDVIIKGSLPVDSMDAIKAMFNRGIRFWHDDLVGRYNRPNKVVKAQ